MSAQGGAEADMSYAGADGRHAGAEGLHAAVQSAIAASVGARAVAWSDAEFDALALRLFAHQFAHCAPYRRFCEGRGATPASVRSHRAIPAVPTDVFKTVPLATFPPEEAVATYLTSGTTVGTRGRHLLRTTATYEASLAPSLRRWLDPQGDRPLVLALACPGADDPHSSLAFMIDWAVREVGAPGSRHCWDGGPEVPALVAALERVVRPVLLLGTARALQHLLETRLVHEGLPLPPGSRLMETGGFKGASATLSPEAFYAGLAAGLSIPDAAIVGEYGMTELGSQGYHGCWRAEALRGDRTAGARSVSDRRLVFPPWCRVGAVDPDTLELLPDGARGLLRFWDLANVESVLAVQTADVGIVTPGGVWLEGRAPGSTPRGCSLAVDELLRTAR